MSIHIIKESFLNEMPDWVKAGEKVAVTRRNHGGNQLLQFFEVTKVTATQVVIGGYRYNLKNGLREMGRTGSYQSVPFLADPNDPAVVYLKLRTKERLARMAVKLRAETFASSGDETDATNIQKALDAWHTARADVDDFAADHEENKK